MENNFEVIKLNEGERIAFDDVPRIYSFNLAAFILTNLSTDYKIELDEELKSYFVFPKNEVIEKHIRLFKRQDKKLILFDTHKFLKIYKQLRRESIELKNRFLNEK